MDNSHRELHIGESSSDSFFVDDDNLTVEACFVDEELLCSHPTTHSELYRATRRGRHFVLKSLKAEYRDNIHYRNLLYKEYEIGVALDHPNIVKTIGWEQVEGLGDVVVLEYIDGVNLKEAMERRMITPILTRRIALQLCDALDYMHSQQCIHRDLKPSNIMVTHNGNNVKIIDFGLSDSDSHIIFKQPAGTLRYAAPELLAGRRIDCRADIYSLGCILLEMPSSRDVVRIARRCIALKPERRYANMAEVKRAIEGRRRRVAMWVVVAAVVIVLVVALWRAAMVDRAISDIKHSVPEEMLGDKSGVLLAECVEHLVPMTEERFDALFATLGDVDSTERLAAFDKSLAELHHDLTVECDAMLNSHRYVDEVDYDDAQARLRFIVDEAYDQHIQEYSKQLHALHDRYGISTTL